MTKKRKKNQAKEKKNTIVILLQPLLESTWFLVKAVRLEKHGEVQDNLSKEKIVCNYI